ncbi:metallophosphoesterase [Paraburkholderia phymatum]|uniref:Metallophosphoesterase n=1 Tax=Paraburkholderia phymatum (strain DSM 17167 / CIP 108236 / LMG 21445 / STM815) TaxID=391038 RepID=B2JS91_PARP8|nr:metallophosphoesterase [Paraburkholderia phymatum]ACC72468.1 metallophosphoesterase [Paraburkholderia phymatum STM815]
MREPYRAVHRYSRNESGRDFVVGDIHGCFAQLRAELQARNFDPQRDRLFAVGDLVDRGPQSDTLLETVEQYGIRSVKGNHEDVIVRWHAGDEQAFSLLSNGGNWLLDRADDREWVNAIAAYMASLPYLIEIETEHGLVGIVHADSPVSDWNRLVVDIEREKADGKLRRKAIWSRTRWKTYQPHPAPSRNTLRNLLDRATHSVRSQMHAPGRIENVAAVIVGHTPVSGVTAKDNVINIDTGAVYGGKLTIIDLADLPKWIDVYAGAPGDAAERARLEPAMAAHIGEPAFSDGVFGVEVPVLAESVANAELPVTADEAVVDYPALMDIPVNAMGVDMDGSGPRFAPEAKPARPPLRTSTPNTMHITVRMSMFNLVSERQQGAASHSAARPRRR